MEVAQAPIYVIVRSLL